MDRTCDCCGKPMFGIATKRWCSPACKARGNSRVKCSTCDGMAWVGGRSSASPRCSECRAPKHGDLAMYDKHECRCGVCRGAKAADARAYRARRKAEGRPIERSGPESECAHCAAPFRARTDQPGLYCSTDCVKLAQGWDPGQSRRRFRPTPTLRATIYERDGWTCQICGLPVDPGAKPRTRDFPSLDHIVPRSRGGSDEPSNLRLAHMGCNADRGAPSPERGPRVPVRVLRVR